MDFANVHLGSCCKKTRTLNLTRPYVVIRRLHTCITNTSCQNGRQKLPKNVTKQSYSHKKRNFFL
jgi:hypothetical protein